MRFVLRGRGAITKAFVRMSEVDGKIDMRVGWTMDRFVQEDRDQDEIQLEMQDH